MRLGWIRVVGDTADHHHRSLVGVDDLYLGEGLPVLTGVLTLQCPRSSTLALISEPQTVGLGLLDYSDEGLGIHFTLQQ